MYKLASGVLAFALGCSASPADEPEAVTWFTDASPQLLVTSPVMGVSIGDVDGDGLDDILTSGGSGRVTLLRNLGELRFEDVSAAAAMPGDAMITGVALADMDNDGDMDALLAGTAGVELWLNDGSGRFSATTTAMADGRASFGVTLLDADRDGRIDVLAIAEQPPHALWRNAGDGTFTSTFVGSADSRTWTAAAIDYDGDGAQDLYIANDMLTVDSGERPMVASGTGSPDQLLRNDGDAWVDVTAATGISEPRSTMGVVFGDLNDDGRADLFLSDYGRNDLLLGHTGGFSDDGTAAGLALPWRSDDDCADTEPLPRSNCWFISWGAAYADFDLDGLDDLIVVNSHVTGDRAQPANAWRRNTSAEFERVESGLGWLTARGIAAADLDQDGDVDLVVPSRDSLRIFANTSSSAAAATTALSVRLRGVSGNPHGLGARVYGITRSGRRISRFVGSGGVPHSWSAHVAPISAGDDLLKHIEVHWPSGVIQVAQIPSAGNTLVITEPIASAD